LAKAQRFSLIALERVAAGTGVCFQHRQRRVPVLCERAGLLADLAAANRRTYAKLLTTTGCPARFNLDRIFFSGSTVPEIVLNGR
jgi:hypothetical protein